MYSIVLNKILIVFYFIDLVLEEVRVGLIIKMNLLTDLNKTWDQVHFVKDRKGFYNSF